MSADSRDTYVIALMKVALIVYVALIVAVTAVVLWVTR